MSLLSEILQHNEQFVANHEYEVYRTSGMPNKRLVVVSCMDTRLTELLPKAMNLKNGDAKIIKVAGAIVDHPFGSVMRSVLFAVHLLDAREVCVVGHYQCGMDNPDHRAMVERIVNAGVSQSTIRLLENSGIDLYTWLGGFSDVKDSVRKSVETIARHPLMPQGVPVHGLVIDPVTGKLDVIVEGY